MNLGVEFVKSWQDADIVFIAGATMFSRETLEKIKAAKKKIVLRVDNIPKNSANRNCGISRLKACAEAADLVIYQSQWSRDLLIDLIGKDGEVIYNGADTDIFYPSKNRPRPETYVYSRFGRGELKGWEMTWYAFQELHRTNVETTPELTIVGKFSPEQVEYGFDFFNGEKIKYLGVINDPHVWADILRSTETLIAPYIADACSNTIIEARLCGCLIETLDTHLLPSNLAGGTPEILDLPVEQLTIEHMAKAYLKTLNAL